MKMQLLKVTQQGSILLEALIAILIFSIGILSLVGMQAAAINNAADAKYRSSAGFLADQIIGTMWATAMDVANASAISVTQLDPTFACDPCTTGNGNAWTQAWMASGVGANLPNGTASIVINGATADVTVSVFWQDPNDAAVHRHIVSTVIN